MSANPAGEDTPAIPVFGVYESVVVVVAGVAGTACDNYTPIP
jgi:hypothetical protein